MTFFLSEQPAITRRGPNVPLPTNADGVGAAVTSYFREIDSFNGISARTEMESIYAGKDAGERLGIEALNQWYQENDAGYDHLRPAPATVDDFIAMHGPRATEIILDLARQSAQKDPAGWADIDVSKEGIDQRALDGLKASDAVDAQNLALSPNPIRNAIVGGLVAGAIDPVNLATIPLGLGGGSFLRTVAREALLNGAVEALQHPARARTAEMLGKEAPSLLESVAVGMTFGGVVAGGLDGVPRLVRGLMAAKEARRLERTPDISHVTQEAAVQSAERAIAEGRPVDAAVTQAILSEPPAARRPLILDESMAVTPEPTALAPDPITEAPLPPAEGIPSTTDQIVATAKSGIAKAGKPKKEVLGWLKRQGVDPGGWLGTELKARGLSNKTHRGLFRNGGLKDIDNIVADELDQSIPGVSWQIGRDQSGIYLDRDGVLRALDDEIAPPRQPKAYGRAYDPQRAWADPDIEDRGFLVNDLPARQMAEPDTWRQTLEADIDAYIDQKGVVLLPRERAEIKAIAASRGGDVDDLLHSVTLRDIDEADQAHLRAMRGEAYGRPASNVPWGDEAGMGALPDSPGGGLAGEPQAAAGNAPAAGARNLEPPLIERTDIGDQYVIPGSREAPGVDRQRQQAEIEARKIQSKIRRLNQARVEDEVDGLFAQKQVDLFDDLSSPEAQSFMDANIQAMRDMLDEGDLQVAAVADDGRALTSLSDILDEIDGDETMMREYELCRFGGGATE